MFMYGLQFGVVFDRDKSEELMELSEEKKKEIQQKENARWVETYMYPGPWLMAKGVSGTWLKH